MKNKMLLFVVGVLISTFMTLNVNAQNPGSPAFSVEPLVKVGNQNELTDVIEGQCSTSELFFASGSTFISGDIPFITGVYPTGDTVKIENNIVEPRLIASGGMQVFDVRNDNIVYFTEGEGGSNPSNTVHAVDPITLEDIWAPVDYGVLPNQIQIQTLQDGGALIQNLDNGITTCYSMDQTEIWTTSSLPYGKAWWLY